jgi:hypothetical protein
MHTLSDFRTAAMAAALLVTLGAAHAQSGEDPTRPPPSVLAPPAGGAAAQAIPSTPEPLSSARIIVTGPSRRFVVVDGFMVRVGETYKDAKLVDVGPDGAVWLRNGVREIDYGGGRVAKAPPGMQGAPGAATPRAAASTAKNKPKSGESPR